MNERTNERKHLLGDLQFLHRHTYSHILVFFNSTMAYREQVITSLILILVFHTQDSGRTNEKNKKGNIKKEEI